MGNLCTQPNHKLTENGFQQIRKVSDYTVPSEVTCMKVLLVKVHVRNGKESFRATFTVGLFN